MSHPKKRVTILGSTGSVGSNTLDVLARHPDRFEVFALTASTQVELMVKQCTQFTPVYAVMASEEHGKARCGVPLPLTRSLRMSRLTLSWRRS
jgi:1-deoxy-D-xylulose-5-phosphate reductoisomerase